MCKGGSWSCGLNNKRQKTEAGSNNDRVFTLCQSVLQLKPTVLLSYFLLSHDYTYTFLHGYCMKELLVISRSCVEPTMKIFCTSHEHCTQFPVSMPMQ